MVTVKYYMSYGKCDCGPVCELDVELTKEEQKIYDSELQNIKNQKAKELNIDPSEVELTDDDIDSLNNHPALHEALLRAEKEACDYEISEYGNEEIMEALGEVPMDSEELNELVHNKDPHAIKFFGLEKASEEEIEEWDADYLDDLPNVCDFKENFEPDEVPMYVHFTVESE